MGKGELSERDLRAILDFLRANYSLEGHEGYIANVVHGLPRVVSSDLTAYCEIDPVTQTSANWLDRPKVDTPEAQRIWAQHMLEMPVVAHYLETGDGRALKVTDFMSQRKFRDTGVYTEHYRPKRLEYILATWVPSERFAIGIGFHRDGQDFSDRERLLLELLRPHLIQAWRNTQVAAKMRERARLAGAFGALPVIVLGDGGRVVFVGERARRALERHFGGSERAQTIPEPILGWARRIRNAIGAEADEIPASAAPFVHDGAAGRIVIRAFTGDENIVLLIEAPQDPQRLAPLALTKREGEVLAWVAEGKTNEDIAMIVHCAPKTVEKHLEHIYQKLDVPNRAAAAAMAAVLLSEML